MRIARCVLNDQPTYGYADTYDDTDVFVVATGDPLYGELKATGQVVPLADVRLLAPVIPRSKVVGIGRNYADHAREMGNDVPSEPLVFLKPNTSVVGPGDPIVMPAYSSDVQFEGELAVVIGRVCKDVPVERAAEVIAGYTCANDVTARDVQRSDATWARAKGFDGACPLGPWLVPDVNPSSWTLTTTVDGEERQRASSDDMIFGVGELISYVSGIFSLLPGDVILTGTPAGVGPVEPGQTVEVTVDGVGTLSNMFVRG